MKLNPEGVQKAAEAGYIRRQDATAALTAYFDHLKETGRMREARMSAYAFDGQWVAEERWNQTGHGDDLALIIRAEK